MWSVSVILPKVLLEHVAKLWQKKKFKNLNNIISHVFPLCLFPVFSIKVEVSSDVESF